MTDYRKRYTAWILTAAAVFSLCTGCRKEKDTNEPENSSINVTQPKNPTILQATVTSRELNVRSEIGYDAPVVSTLQKGETATILQREELDGISWGKTEEGWICLLYVSMEEIPMMQIQQTSSTVKNHLYEAKIIVDELNIRSGPGTKNEKMGTYSWGQLVQVLEEDGTWGKTELGWISLGYTYIEGHPDNISQQTRVRARSLHVRKGPGTAYESILELEQGTEVTILKQGTFGGSKWGYTGTGWLCMDYVDPI